MPLTAFQTKIAKLLSQNRSSDSYLAGGAALHLTPNSLRYSKDLDYFHDSVERVARAFSDDESLLHKHGYAVTTDMKQPGYVRAIAEKESQQTKIEWAHDSDWRFLPVIKDALCGYRLHPIDIAINKVLALAGRNEPRDFLDVLHLHEQVLSLGALCWAAAAKDPGFTPLSLLELLKRRGKFQPEDFDRLELVGEKIVLTTLKSKWLNALEVAETFIKKRPPTEVGCLYYSPSKNDFITPEANSSDQSKMEHVTHYGRPGGIWPRLLSD